MKKYHVGFILANCLGEETSDRVPKSLERYQDPLPFMSLRDTPGAMRKYKRERVAAARKAFFAGKVCVQCGSDEKLELDHIDPSTKKDHKVWTWSKIRRDAEIAKCQVLCKQCHKTKTSEENRKRFQKGQCDGIHRGAYRKGCRCNKCKIANKLYMRKWKAKRKQQLQN